MSAGASNGWGLGADRSTTGGGLLLANPHFPWEGELRFWENHLTIPGELNVYGVGLTGLPGVQIGFNDAVAWTHTVSAGHRFTLYRYDLDPTDPTTYLVDGEPQRDGDRRHHDRRARRRRLHRRGEPHALRHPAGPVVDGRSARLDRRAGGGDRRRQPRDRHGARAVPRDGHGRRRWTSSRPCTSSTWACRGSTRSRPAPTAGRGSSTRRPR